MPKAIALISLLLILTNRVDAGLKYSIDAKLDPDTGTITGVVHAVINNLDGYLVILYPEIYLNEVYPKSYPKKFNPGSIDILSITDGENNPLELRRIKGPVFRIQTPDVKGCAITTLRIRFITRIPERLGPFGYHEGIMTLQGGWHPLLSKSTEGELPSSDYIVRMSVPLPYTILHTGVLMSEEIKREEIGGDGSVKRVIEFEANNIKSPTIVISKRFVKVEDRIGGSTFEYYFLEKDRWYIDRVAEIVNLAVDFFRRNLHEVGPGTIKVGEVYLYSDMAMAGEDVLLINNRIFKVFPYLRRFHERQLVRSLYTIYWRRIIMDEDWVAEGMADYSTDLYIEERYHARPDLAEGIRRFSFIPAIDHIIYSPRLPFRRVYFFTESIEEGREDIRLLNSKRLEGDRIFSKLRNLIGKDRFEEVIRRYIQSLDKGDERHPNAFRDISSEVSKRRLDWFYHQWLKEIPATDYYLKEVKRGKKERLYLTEITIGKRGKGIEPVELYTKDAEGNEGRDIWGGEGEEFIIERYTSSPIKIIEIDPEKKLSDLNRYNNRIPRPWKYLLNRIRLSYDFQTHNIEADIIISLERLYNPDNRFDFNYYHRFELDGIRIGYDHIGDDKAISLSIGIERFSDEFFRLKGHRYAVSPVLSYRRGGIIDVYKSIEIGVEPSSKIIGSDYSYLKLWITAIREFRIANNESIAFRAILGQSGGGVPEHKLFFLGGITGARGFSKAEDRGRNIALFTGEYRFPLIYDLDRNLLSLITAHTLQAVLFGDTGMVSDKRDTFRFEEYKHDVGIGLRFHVNLFGIYPGIGRLDMAMPVGHDVKHRPAFYISIGQSF